MKLGEQNKNTSSGSFELPAKNKPIIKVIKFIQKGLDQFSEEFKDSDVQNEDGLSHELCKLLNDRRNKEPFSFLPEIPEDSTFGHSPSVDLGAIARKIIKVGSNTFPRRSAFFLLEAKRLPTTGSGRAKEYVIGIDKKINGGIQRFKEGRHGAKIEIGALIAYVQKNDFDYWFSKVNQWIEEQYDETKFWNEADKLKPISPFYKKAKSGFYKSKSKRRGKNIISDEIELYHFWVDLN